MQHTFQVSFLSPTGLKRKYCFSLPDANSRTKWGTLLQHQIAATKAVPMSSNLIRTAAEGVALQVLRDAVIPMEPETKRSGSVSVVYKEGDMPFRPKVPAQKDDGSGAGEFGDGLNELDERDGGDRDERDQKDGSGGRGKMSGLMDVQTGKELVLLCRQNSLLPGLLELLQVGKGSA